MQLGNEARFPKVITTVQCSVCSQLNNKARIVVTEFSFINCTIPAIYGFTQFTLQPTQPRHNNYKLCVCANMPT